MPPLLFDYSDYIERTCYERDAVYRDDISAAEVERTGRKYINQDLIPGSLYHVDRAYQLFIDLCVWPYYAYGRNWFTNLWYHYKDCPFCSIPLTKLTNSEQYQSDVNFKSLHISVCEHCGWWESEEEPEEGNGQSYESQSVHRRAYLKTFDFNGHQTPVQLLADYLVKHPDQLNSITPKRLEVLATSVFKDFFNCEALHVGGTNDQGIDILLINGDFNCAVQVKRRINAKKAEPVSLMREFIGAMILNSKTKGIYVTTANKFSAPAVHASKKVLNLTNIEFIELYDAKRLMDVMRDTSKNKIPNWARPASQANSIYHSMETGFSRFLELAMGGENWSVNFGQRDYAEQDERLKAYATDFIKQFPNSSEFIYYNPLK